MPYVRRNADGILVALADQPAEGAAEWLGPTDTEVLEFLYRDRSEDPAEARLVASDLGMLRVMEDLIALLIAKRVIAWTDLPQAAQNKLIERRGLRRYLSAVTGMSSVGSQQDPIGLVGGDLSDLI